MKTLSKFKPLLLGIALSLPVAQADNFPISGKLGIDTDNISGLVISENFAALATDEGTAIQILPRQGKTFVANSAGVIALTDNDLELDLEGLAWQAPYLYAIGSHSQKRKKVKAGADDKKNLKRLTEIIEEPSRHQLFQIKLDAHGKVQNIKSQSLDKWLADEPILNPFRALPSKENGIDIEGIAVTDKHLFIGFRGPVLRGNLATVLRFKLKADQFELSKAKLKLVNLGGLGIRDMLAHNKELILLAGPVNEIPKTYQLFHWQGEHQLSPIKPTLTLPEDLRGKPEAIALDPRNTLWMGQDGIKNGGIQAIQLNR